MKQNQTKVHMWIVFKEYGSAYTVDKNGYLNQKAQLKDGSLDKNSVIVCSNVDGVNDEFMEKMKSMFGNFKLDESL